MRQYILEGLVKFFALFLPIYLGGVLYETIDMKPYDIYSTGVVASGVGICSYLLVDKWIKVRYGRTD